LNTKTWALVPSVATLALGLGSQAFAIDDGQGRDWRPLTATNGLSRASVAAQCPSDGVTECTGALGSIDLDEWTWATDQQVLSLFGQYVPDILTSANFTVGGVQYAAASDSFMASFGLTSNFSGCPTYQGCFEFRQSAGQSASTNQAGSAIGGSVQLGGFFAIAPFTPNDGVARGFFLWRPTGKVDGTVHAYKDKGQLTSPNGGSAIANVLANDYAAGVRATTSNVSLELVGSAPEGVSLDLTDGSVDVAAGTPIGTYTLRYQICLLANLAICDDTTATVVVPSFAIVANPDQGQLAVEAGGVAVANVLVNDTIGGVRATVSTVILSTVSTTHPGVSLNTATGAVNVAPGTTSGNHSLVYSICERSNPVRCAQATVTILPNRIDAVDDYFRMYSKAATTSPSVFNNDWYNSGRPTSAVVRATIIGTLPKGVLFNSTTGSFYTLGKVSSGLFYTQYKICEIASPGNCDQANVTLDLSGNSGTAGQ
jgi:hypothetical protein